MLTRAEAEGELDMKQASLSIIIPMLNEVESIASSLEPLLHEPCVREIIVVDGGSTDESVERVKAFAGGYPSEPIHCLVSQQPGRARQMNLGVQHSRGDVLVFLHADTQLPVDGLERIRDSIAAGAFWGHFDVHLKGPQRMLRVVEHMMNWRSALSGIATGDQVMFVRRDVFLMLGGFPEIPLMEDIGLSQRLKWVARPVRIKDRALTSARRWQERGMLRTIALMWALRSFYAMGVAPARLASWYRQVR